MRIALTGGVRLTTTDRWLTELRAGRCFTGYADLAAPGVGNTAKIQLFNPVGSLIRVICYMIVLRKPTAGPIQVARHTAGLVTNEVNVQNLLLGGAAPVGQVRSEGTVAGLGTGWQLLRVQADTLTFVRLPWLFEAPVANGLHLENLTANEGLSVGYFWNEA